MWQKVAKTARMGAGGVFAGMYAVVKVLAALDGAALIEQTYH
jgi:hypothetical protein